MPFIPRTSPPRLSSILLPWGDDMDNAADGWRRFAQTGSIYDYLTYKTQQNAAREDVYANCNNGSGAAPGQGGEADRILTILTPDLGSYRPRPGAACRMKSPMFSATGLFLLL